MKVKRGQLHRHEHEVSGAHGGTDQAGIVRRGVNEDNISGALGIVELAERKIAARVIRGQGASAVAQRVPAQRRPEIEALLFIRVNRRHCIAKREKGASQLTDKCRFASTALLLDNRNFVRHAPTSAVRCKNTMLILVRRTIN